MKSLFLLMAALFCCMLSNAQSSMSCCSPTQRFALFASNHAFANPSNPDHNEADTKNAYSYTLQFLKARIK